MSIRVLGSCSADFLGLSPLFFSPRLIKTVKTGSGYSWLCSPCGKACTCLFQCCPGQCCLSSSVSIMSHCHHPSLLSQIHHVRVLLGLHLWRKERRASKRRQQGYQAGRDSSSHPSFPRQTSLSQRKRWANFLGSL